MKEAFLNAFKSIFFREIFPLKIILILTVFNKYRNRYFIIIIEPIINLIFALYSLLTVNIILSLILINK